MKIITYLALLLILLAACKKNDSTPAGSDESSAGSIKLVFSSSKDTLLYSYVKAVPYTEQVLGATKGIYYDGYLTSSDTTSFRQTNVRFYVNEKHQLEIFKYVDTATKENDVTWGALGFLLYPNDVYEGNVLKVKSNLHDVDASVMYEKNPSGIDKKIEIKIGNPFLSNKLEYASLELR